MRQHKRRNAALGGISIKNNRINCMIEPEYEDYVKLRWKKNMIFIPKITNSKGCLMLFLGYIS